MKRLDIQIIAPTPRSRKGNWVTAARWSRILRGLGHRVTILQAYEDRTGKRACDLLVALHAKKSLASIERFHQQNLAQARHRPLIVTLTGTDLYRDIRLHEDAQSALTWADRLILLQPEGRDELAPALRDKARVIRQSAVPTQAKISKTKRWFDICVVGHLRPVKDPFRAAAAARLLPNSSRIRILQAGAALELEMAEQAREEMKINPRYRWLGSLPPWQVRRLFARSHLMVLSSRMEGGANVVSEAVVANLPVVSTHISGSIGLLGKDHQGYFKVGDTQGLAALMTRCEQDPDFLLCLTKRSTEVAPLFHPDREVEAWEKLLQEL